MKEEKKLGNEEKFIIFICAVFFVLMIFFAIKALEQDCAWIKYGLATYISFKAMKHFDSLL